MVVCCELADSSLMYANVQGQHQRCIAHCRFAGSLIILRDCPEDIGSARRKAQLTIDHRYLEDHNVSNAQLFSGESFLLKFLDLNSSARVILAI